MVRRQASHLRLERPAEGPHVGVSAGVADLCQRHVGVPHQQAGSFNPHAVDKPAEVGVQPVREEMGQVGHADADRPAGALQVISSKACSEI